MSSIPPMQNTTQFVILCTLKRSIRAGRSVRHWGEWVFYIQKDLMAHLQTSARRNISTKTPLLYTYDAAFYLEKSRKNWHLNAFHICLNQYDFRFDRWENLSRYGRLLWIRKIRHHTNGVSDIKENIQKNLKKNIKSCSRRSIRIRSSTWFRREIHQRACIFPLW